jgi:Abnormal spindle-like microcephaly-assoc'd, ASPM-SPD-2-Hydin
MRIPHRSPLSLSLRFVAFTTLTSLAAVLPIYALAAKPQLTCSPSSLNFRDVPMHQSQTQLLVLRNSGTTSTTISSISASPSNFKVTGMSLPFVLAAGQSAGINVTFSPSASTWVAGSITFASNATNSAMKVSAQGGGVVKGQLQAQPSSVAFGQVPVGSSVSQSVVLTNTASGKTRVRGFQVSGTEFSVSGPTTPFVLSAGQPVTLTVKFSPQAAGLVSGNVGITGAGFNIPLTATGTTSTTTGQLVVSPSTLNLGSILVGSSGTASGSLSASGASVTVTADSVNNSAFTVSGLSLPVSIPAGGESVPFTVKFTPTAAGSASATLAFTSNAQTSSTTESLTGTGSAAPGQLALSPSTLSFGNVDVGTTATQATKATASGASVTISSAAMSNSLFALSGASFPMTLNAGQSAQIYVVFSPTNSGTDSGTLTLNSNASNTKMSESLAGVGVMPQYSVSLSWNASTSSVQGYNIYRGASPGAYSKLNTTVDPNTSYTDSTVTAGATYYYAATSVSSSGQESTYSTPIQVTIP